MSNAPRGAFNNGHSDTFGDCEKQHTVEAGQRRTVVINVLLVETPPPRCRFSTMMISATRRLKMSLVQGPQLAHCGSGGNNGVLVCGVPMCQASPQL